MKIENFEKAKLREDDRFAGVTPKKEPTKGVSGATKFHEKFRKSKRNGNK